MPTPPDAPAPPCRVLLAGRSGSGKTTLGRRLAEVLAIPHVELDALHHGPGWTPRPEFLDDVDRLAKEAPLLRARPDRPRAAS
ncbi:shikimate kinase [Nocardioides sp. zg-DK7169]|uniref:shikimate kinase n=1 Tax=Nocardioides sp. zg-DK7169 TaxID=2736600 RepID=UPI001555E0EC|nr:hypothetical protein [Nocardioides sp. zg-DK7169]